MTSSGIESDWLQDTLDDVADRLRRSSQELAKCAQQLERIVADLQSNDIPRRSQPEASKVAQQVGHSSYLPLQIAITIGSEPNA